MAFNPHRVTATKPGNPAKGFAIDVICWLIVALPLGALSWVAENFFKISWQLEYGLPLIWTAIYLRWGWVVINEMEYLVTERFGSFHAVKFKGLRWKNPILDREKRRGSLKVDGHDLYADEPERAEIDFADGISANIFAKGYVSVGDPVAVANRNWKSVALDVSLWTYKAADPLDIVLTALDGALRPRLEALECSDVQKARVTSVCKEAVEAAEDALFGVGVYPNSAGEALVIKDIDIEEEDQEIRQLRLKGEMAAKEAALKWQGFPLAVEAAVKSAADLGRTITHEHAENLIREQMVIEMLKNSGSNITFLTTDVNAMIASVLNGLQKNGGTNP